MPSVLGQQNVQATEQRGTTGEYPVERQKWKSGKRLIMG